MRYFQWLNRLLALGLLIAACSCGTESNLEDDRRQILQLHDAQRQFHFDKDSISFSNQLSKGFVSVNAGDVSHFSREEMTSRLHGYFGAVSFIKWDDLEEPVLRISQDGSMAYTVVEKVVRVSYEENGEQKTGETLFAWTAIYIKSEDGWKVDCVTSTNKPIVL